MNPVTLQDGTVVDSSSEAWRQECEVRSVLAMPSKQSRRDYLKLVTQRRGYHAVKRLESAIMKYFNATKSAKA